MTLLGVTITVYLDNRLEVVDHLNFLIIFMYCTSHKLDAFKNITVIYSVECHGCRDKSLTSKHLEMLKITVLWALTLFSLVEKGSIFWRNPSSLGCSEAAVLSEVITFNQTS
jgi:hypothetical protein